MKATKILATLPVLALALAACSSTPAATSAPATTAPATAAAATRSASPASPSASAALGAVYKATLLSSNQVPAIAGAEATCTGTATVTVTGAQAKFDITISGCPASAAINIGHIHEGALGANGPVKVDTTLKAGEFVLTGGAGTVSRTAPITAADAAAIAANPAGFYVNLHSTANATGVVRGQLTKG